MKFVLVVVAVADDDNTSCRTGRRIAEVLARLMSVSVSGPGREGMKAAKENNYLVCKKNELDMMIRSMRYDDTEYGI